MFIEKELNNELKLKPEDQGDFNNNLLSLTDDNTLITLNFENKKIFKLR
jgi:hypothetical protein